MKTFKEIPKKLQEKFLKIVDSIDWEKYAPIFDLEGRQLKQEIFRRLDRIILKKMVLLETRIEDLSDQECQGLVIDVYENILDTHKDVIKAKQAEGVLMGVKDEQNTAMPIVGREVKIKLYRNLLSILLMFLLKNEKHKGRKVILKLLEKLIEKELMPIERLRLVLDVLLADLMRLEKLDDSQFVLGLLKMLSSIDNELDFDDDEILKCLRRVLKDLKKMVLNFKQELSDKELLRMLGEVESLKIGNE